jgi:hypothetical protein
LLSQPDKTSRSAASPLGLQLFKTDGIKARPAIPIAEVPRNDLRDTLFEFPMYLRLLVLIIANKSGGIIRRMDLRQMRFMVFGLGWLKIRIIRMSRSQWGEKMPNQKQ